ncbi:MAG: hypothetical protein M1814_005939 [Vezdaea aestivalis]|nr:MAG: hypothetical protein M1814_005939 [Vezdaea aestivalis]
MQIPNSLLLTLLLHLHLTISTPSPPHQILYPRIPGGPSDANKKTPPDTPEATERRPGQIVTTPAPIPPLHPLRTTEFRPTCEASISLFTASNNLIILNNGLSLGSYVTFQALCAAEAFGGREGASMGGVCRAWADEPLLVVRVGFEIEEVLADGRIVYDRALDAMCRNHCRCDVRLSPDAARLVAVGGARAGMEGLGDGKGGTRGDKSEEVDFRLNGYVYRPKYLNGEATRAREKVAPGKKGGKKRCGPFGVVQGKPIWGVCPVEEGEGKCGQFKACGRNDLCGGAESGCGCVARGLSLVTGVFLAATCQLLGSGSSQGLLGGRSVQAEESHCVCNSTYVSAACCQATDGLVWEAPNFKMGILLEQH